MCCQQAVLRLGGPPGRQRVAVVQHSFAPNHHVHVRVPVDATAAPCMGKLHFCSRVLTEVSLLLMSLIVNACRKVSCCRVRVAATAALLLKVTLLSRVSLSWSCC
jgi:hypothetical protein